MEQRQTSTDTSSPIRADFEYTGAPYTGSWSEEHRYNCELTELAMMTTSDREDQIARIKSKRGEDAAIKINMDVQEKRRELIANGTIKVDKPRVKTSNASGGYRGGFNNAGSGPLF
jgi:hypothetical protein